MTLGSQLENALCAIKYCYIMLVGLVCVIFVVIILSKGMTVRTIFGKACLAIVWRTYWGCWEMVGKKARPEAREFLN